MLERDVFLIAVLEEIPHQPLVDGGAVAHEKCGELHLLHTGARR